jgi:hypothetical protein
MGLILIGLLIALLFRGRHQDGSLISLERRLWIAWFATAIFFLLGAHVLNPPPHFDTPLALYILFACVAGIAIAWALYWRDRSRLLRL